MQAQKKLEEEPDDVQKHLNGGRIGFGAFEGRHPVYIPIKIYHLLGEEKILWLAMEAYEAEAMDKFGFNHSFCQNSFLLDLPPIMSGTRRFVAALHSAKRELLEAANDQ